MWSFKFDAGQRDTIASILKNAHSWAIKHKCVVGIAEIALGVGILQYGIQEGLITVGRHIVGTTLSSSLKAGVASSGISAIGFSLLGNIGIAALGGAIGVPSLILTGGASLVFGLAGYAVYDLMSKFNPLLEQGVGITSDLQGGSLVAISVALIIDGCKRLIGSDFFQSVKQAVSSFVQGVLKLIKLACQVVFKNAKDFFDAQKKVTDRRESADNFTDISTFLIFVFSMVSYGKFFSILLLLLIFSAQCRAFIRRIYFGGAFTSDDDEELLYRFYV